METKHLRTVGKGIDITIDYDEQEVYIDGSKQMQAFEHAEAYMMDALEDGTVFEPSEIEAEL